MLKRALTYLNGTEAGLLKSKRFVKPLLGGRAAVIVLARVLKAGFCHTSFSGLRGGADLARIERQNF